MRTPRTEVRPVTADAAAALLESDAAFRDRFGLDVAEGYLAFPEALPATLEALRSGTPPEWFSYLVVDPDQTVVVGLGGFTGPPSDGVVEIGYSVAPAHRGRGHATEAVRLWMDLAARAGVSRVRAHTLPEGGPVDERPRQARIRARRRGRRRGGRLRLAVGAPRGQPVGMPRAGIFRCRYQEK